MPAGGVIAAADANPFTVAGGDLPAVLVRYGADGQVVSTFGTAGEVRVTRTGHAFTLTDLEHAPGGKIVAFGGFMRTETSCGVVVLRFDAATGALDPTFGSGGVVLRGAGGGQPCSFSLQGLGPAVGGGTVLADGRLVVATRYSPSAGQYRVGVFAFTPAGVPDPAFGGGTGLVAVPVTLAGVGRPHIAADGRIVVPLVISRGNTDVSHRLGAIRLLPSGMRDVTFDGDGIATRHPFGTTQFGGVDAVLQSGGRVVVATGFDISGNGPLVVFSDTAVVRFTAGGAADPTFNAGAGYARLPGLFVNRAAAAPDGQIVIAGAQADGTLDDIELPPSTGRVGRLSSEGLPDPRFGPGGTRDVMDAGTNQASQDGVLVDRNENLTFAGWRNTNTETALDRVAPQATLMRFGTSPQPDYVRATIESGLSGSRGVFRGCGSTIATACPIGTTWYFQGNAWPLEPRTPPRVVVQVDRRGGDGLWHRAVTTTRFVTDAGNFRAAGQPTSVGLYRVRAAIPGSGVVPASRYGPWRYLRR
jgi:uncharacterized delta-60 repeat protein